VAFKNSTTSIHKNLTLIWLPFRDVNTKYILINLHIHNGLAPKATMRQLNKAQRQRLGYIE